MATTRTRTRKPMTAARGKPAATRTPARQATPAPVSVTERRKNQVLKALPKRPPGIPLHQVADKIDVPSHGLRVAISQLRDAGLIRAHGTVNHRTWTRT